MNNISKVMIELWFVASSILSHAEIRDTDADVNLVTLSRKHDGRIEEKGRRRERLLRAGGWRVQGKTQSYGILWNYSAGECIFNNIPMAWQARRTLCRTAKQLAITEL